jgi:protoporphyrinogen oxidase
VDLLQGVYTRYPFQTNLYGLPPEVIKECILGFVNARSNHTAGVSNEGTEPMPFAAWIEATLGPGIARHFMTPYNEKLWTVPLDELTCEWMGRFVPSTSLEQILDGALADQSSNAGYNATFSYPLSGGIEALPQAFAASLTNIHTGCELARLDLSKRQLFQTVTLLDFIGWSQRCRCPLYSCRLRYSVPVPRQRRSSASHLCATLILA